MQISNAATNSCRSGYSSCRQHDLTLLRQPCRVLKRLEYIFAFNTGKIVKNILDSASGTNLANAQGADTGFSALHGANNFYKLAGNIHGASLLPL